MTFEVKNLTIELDGRKIVRDVNLTVSDRERVGLIGASGSGKSMITRAVLDTVPEGAVVSGEIIVGGTNILELSEVERAELRGTFMSAVFQDPRMALNPMAKVAANVELPLKLHYNLSKAERRIRIKEALESVGLDASLANRSPSELSGGQAQRVAIAEALISHPQLLIADEPTTALDSIMQQQIIDVMFERAEAERTSLLFISHDFGVISKITQRCYVLCEGQIVEEGQTVEILTNPQHEYTHELVNAAHEIAVEIE